KACPPFSKETARRRPWRGQSPTCPADAGTSGPRVRLVVDAAQAAAVYMAVQLRRRQRAVTQQVLDRAQVGAALQQVRRERMPQAVRMREHAAQRRRVEPTSARRQEERVLRAGRQLRARLVKVLRHEV